MLQGHWAVWDDRRLYQVVKGRKLQDAPRSCAATGFIYMPSNTWMSLMSYFFKECWKPQDLEVSTRSSQFLGLLKQSYSTVNQRWTRLPRSGEKNGNFFWQGYDDEDRGSTSPSQILDSEFVHDLIISSSVECEGCSPDVNLFGLVMEIRLGTFLLTRWENPFLGSASFLGIE